MGCGLASDDGKDFGCEELDRSGGGSEGETAEADLREKTVVAEHLVFPEDLVDDLLGAAGEQGAMRAGPGIEGVAGKCRPPRSMSTATTPSVKVSVGPRVAG